MENVIIHKTDSGVAITTPASEFLKTHTINDCVSRVVPAGVPFKIVNKSQIPSDHTFRNAWEYNDGSIVVNLDKAKAIWKDKWREVRHSLLASLDIEFMKAVESGDSVKQAEIAAKKQALRDVTNTEISGNSPEEIKSVWPEVLGEKQ